MSPGRLTLRLKKGSGKGSGSSLKKFRNDRTFSLSGGSLRRGIALAGRTQPVVPTRVNSPLHGGRGPAAPALPHGATITSAERARVAAAFLPLTWMRLAPTPAATRASFKACARRWPTPLALS